MLSKLSYAALILTALTSQASAVTKAQYAQDFITALGLSVPGTMPSPFHDVLPSDAGATYISMMGSAFPHIEWTGKHWLANKNETLTTEMVVKSATIFKGFPLLSPAAAMTAITSMVPSFSSMGYSQDTVVYLGTLLDECLPASAVIANVEVSSTQEQALISSFVTNCWPVVIPLVLATEPTLKTNRDVPGTQSYYPDGPIVNQFEVRAQLQNDNILHQWTSVQGSVAVDTDSVGYGVGVWGAASTTVSSAKIVGGFFTAVGTGAGANAQLVGQEIDVINYGDGSSTSTSAGIQIVTMGTANSTAAIEIIGQHPTSKWDHGLMFGDDSLSQYATVIGLAQDAPVHIGIDFSNTPFSHSAVYLNKGWGGQLKWKPANGGNPTILTNDDSGWFVLRTAPNGFAVKSNDYNSNLLTLDHDGDLEPLGGLVLKSPNGTKYRIWVDDGGGLHTALN